MLEFAWQHPEQSGILGKSKQKNPSCPHPEMTPVNATFSWGKPVPQNPPGFSENLSTALLPAATLGTISQIPGKWWPCSQPGASRCSAALLSAPATPDPGVWHLCLLAAAGEEGIVSCKECVWLWQARWCPQRSAKMRSGFIQGFMVTATSLSDGAGECWQESSFWRTVFIKLGMGFPTWGILHKWRDDLDTGKTFFLRFIFGA